MASPNPWGKQPSKNNCISSELPRVQPPKSSIATLVTQYKEIQEDELIALASIYGDDFVKIETKQGAWMVRRYTLDYEAIGAEIV
jgi:translation initiation factor 2-alpha kinase 4